MGGSPSGSRTVWLGLLGAAVACACTAAPALIVPEEILLGGGGTTLLVHGGIESDGCNAAAKLQVQTHEESGALRVKVLGWARPKGRGGGPCTQAVVDKTAEVSLPPAWLRESGEHPITIEVAGKTNELVAAVDTAEKTIRVRFGPTTFVNDTRRAEHRRYLEGEEWQLLFPGETREEAPRPAGPARGPDVRP